MTGLPRFVAIDTETTRLNLWKGGRMFVATACWDNGKQQFWREDFTGLREILMDASVDKVMQNAKYDLRALGMAGFEVRGKVWDTMIDAHLLDGRDSAGGLNLERMSVKYLSPQFRKVVDEIKDWFDARNVPEDDRDFSTLPPELLERRASGDTQLTALIFRRIHPTVAHYFPYLLRQEHALLPVVKRMEDRGVLLDVAGMEPQREAFEMQLEDALEYFRCLVGREDFNINSPNDQMEALECAGLLDRIAEKTPTGRPKMSATNLHQLHHPTAFMMLMGRTAAKMLGSFLDTLQANVAADGCVHANFNQVGTSTGRFSCSNPNLQNLPIEGGHRLSGTAEELEEVFDLTGSTHRPHIRSLFLVRPGFFHIHADKQKAELAMLAHYSRDENLMRIIRAGLDVHGEVARLIFGENSKALRRRTKDMVFGVIYGASVKRLATRTGGNYAQAKNMKDKMMRMLPGLNRWLRDLANMIATRGFVQTDHGRRHYFYKNESYKAVSGMCQGTVGDEVKSCMVRLDPALAPLGGMPLLNVHDEIAAEALLENGEEAIRRTWKVMNETSIPYRVPLLSSMSVSMRHWGEQFDVEMDGDTPHIVISRDKEGNITKALSFQDWVAEYQHTQRDNYARAGISA